MTDQEVINRISRQSMIRTPKGMKFTTVFYKMHNALKSGKTLVVSYGGSSSGKTIAALQYLAMKCMLNKNLRVVVVGASLPKLRLTCIQDFKKIVMGDYYDYKSWNDTKAFYSFDNGSEIRFVGADNADRFVGVRADYVLYDEATEIPNGAFDQLYIRTRIASIVTFNPASKFWIVKHMDKEYCSVIHSTYKDNPFVPEQIVKALESKMATDENFYKVYGKGEWGVLEGRIYTNYNIVYEFPSDWKWRVTAVDFGWIDPYVGLDILEFDTELYAREIFYKQYLTDKEASNRLLKHFQAIGMRTEVVCDSASPRSIHAMQLENVPAIPCRKGADSILWGIRTVSSKKLNILSSSVNIITELENYKWKVNKITGESMSIPEDKFNHAMDALRYGVSHKLDYSPDYIIG